MRRAFLHATSLSGSSTSSAHGSRIGLGMPAEVVAGVDGFFVCVKMRFRARSSRFFIHLGTLLVGLRFYGFRFDAVVAEDAELLRGLHGVAASGVDRVLRNVVTKRQNKCQLTYS